MPDALPAADEYFLDDYQIEQVSGLTRSVNRPTKSGDNPIFGNAAWTWDLEPNWSSRVVFIEGVGYVSVYLGYDSSANAYSCVATSADGLTGWSKANLGIVSFGGNTNNNILLTSPSSIANAYYDAANTPAWVGVGNLQSGSLNNGIHIFTGTDHDSWAYDQTLFETALAPNYREAKGIVQRPDGRWLLYYMGQGLGQHREIGVYLSDTSDVGSTWVDKGIVIDCRLGQEVQHYYGYPFRLGPLYLMTVGLYPKTAETMITTLWVSRDGMAWQQKDAAWLGLGAAAAWDDKMVISGAGLVAVGDVWRHYFTGFAEDHATFPRSARLGYATMPRGRLGQISGTGYVTTRLLTIPAGQKLYVNCDGALEVECFDSAGRLISYRDRGNCDPITGDNYDTEVTWSDGESLPNNQDVRLRFHLSGGTLFNYSFAS